MEGINQIIQKILSDAEDKAKGLKDNADKIISEKDKEATDWVKNYLDTQLEILEKDSKEIISRRLTVADLDVRKIILEAKSKVIEKTFNVALEKLCALSKQEYLRIVERLIEENAEEQDVVYLSCDNVLEAEDIKRLAVYKNKKLTVAESKIQEKGGVLLANESCDKTLTFKAILDNEKSNLITKVAQKLFGEN